MPDYQRFAMHQARLERSEIFVNLLVFRHRDYVDGLIGFLPLVSPADLSSQQLWINGEDKDKYASRFNRAPNETRQRYDSKRKNGQHSYIEGQWAALWPEIDFFVRNDVGHMDCIDGHI